MLDVVFVMFNIYGKENVNLLLLVFEEFLKNVFNDVSYDVV